MVTQPGGQQQDSGVPGSLCLAESGEFPQSQGGLALLSKNWLKGTGNISRIYGENMGKPYKTMVIL